MQRTARVFVVELEIGNIANNPFFLHGSFVKGCQSNGRSIVEPTSSTITTRFMRLSVQVIDIVKISEWKQIHSSCVAYSLWSLYFCFYSPRSSQGGFAKVKRGRHILTGEKVAIKIMNKKDLGVSIAEAQCR